MTWPKRPRWGIAILVMATLFMMPDITQAQRVPCGVTVSQTKISRINQTPIRDGLQRMGDRVENFAACTRCRAQEARAKRTERVQRMAQAAECRACERRAARTQRMNARTSYFNYVPVYSYVTAPEVLFYPESTYRTVITFDNCPCGNNCRCGPDCPCRSGGAVSSIDVDGVPEPVPDPAASSVLVDD